MRQPVPVLVWWCFREARPTVQIVFLLRVLSGWALTQPTEPPPATGLAAWFCVVMAVYLLNGLRDLQEDRANASPRPIARGALPVRTARQAMWTLAGCGMLLGFATSAWLGLLAVTGLGLGWLYSVPRWRLKRRSLGTVTVALTGIWLTYYAGAAMEGRPRVGPELLAFGGAMSLWAGLVGATTKDLPDLAGDRSAGIRSWPMVWGVRRFRVMVSAMALLVGAGFGLAALLVADRLLAPAAVLLAGAVAVAAALHRAGPLRRPYRAFMATQYAAHLVLLSIQIPAIVS